MKYVKIERDDAIKKLNNGIQIYTAGQPVVSAKNLAFWATYSIFKNLAGTFTVKDLQSDSVRTYKTAKSAIDYVKKIEISHLVAEE